MMNHSTIMEIVNLLMQKSKIQRTKVSLPLENSEGITVLIEPMASSKSLFEFLVRKLNDEDVDSRMSMTVIAMKYLIQRILRGA